MTAKKVSNTSRVTIRYAMALPDGTEVSSSETDGESLQFTIGDGTLIPPLEQLLIGEECGAEQIYILEPEQAFGWPDEENRQVMQRSLFRADKKLEAGDIHSFALPDGEEIAATIVSVDEKEVVVDFNHPLAGYTITFSFTILAIE